MKTGHKITVLAIMFGLFVWIFDAVLDYLIFYGGSFWDSLIFNISMHDMYMRLFIFTTIIVFGIITSRIMVKREDIEESAKKLEVAYDQAAIYAEELNKEIAERKMAQEELQKAYDQTEERIKWRTAELSEANTLLGKEIAERKETEEALRESEDRSRSISTSAKDAIVMMDNDGNVSYWNPAAEKMFGHTTEEAIGKKLHVILAPERYHEAYLEGFSAFKETGKGAAVGKTLELKGVRKDGKEFLVELSMNAIRIKGQWHAVGIMRDITKRKRAEEKLEKQTHNLGERVKELQCLYGISKLLEIPDASLENIVQGTVNLIPPSWQYPEITCAQVVFDGQEFKTEGFRKTVWKLVGDIVVGGEPIGSVQVYYQEEKPEVDEGPFIKEERRLIDAIAERLATIIELRQVGNGLARTHDQLEEANKKLQFAYAQMRDWRDRLGTQLHGEEIGFLIDEKGQILGVTEKAMESTGQSRIKLLGGNIADLVDEEDKYEVKDNIKKAWGGVFRKSLLKVMTKRSGPQKFETKFMRVNPEHGRMLLVLMRESYEDDKIGKVD